ncbi:poly(U)-specific 3'-to-5' RNA exonuclease [Kalmusia sp. IMI 367209]|nr:poly(U)-specific 3'-to-5' RNA exonuclease [Kalmusia sp. IMI 367209]
MSLVQYSDSDSDNADANPPMPSNALKRKRIESGQANPMLPPLPAAFHDLYSTNARVSTSDDPGLHGGRKRAVPHVEGNWPSHVYLEWVPSQADFQKLNSLIDHVRDSIEAVNSRLKKALPIPDIHPSLLSELGTPVPLHVSLSRTLQIKTDDREPFLEVLTSSLRKAAVRPFNVRFTGLKWVPNYERNRWFLVLGIEKPAQDELNRLLDACNDAAEKCGHPPLYVGGKGDGPMEDNNPRHPSNKSRKSMQQDAATKARTGIDRSENYHVSIAWNLLEPDSEWINLAQGLDVSKFVLSPHAPFDAVKAKIGNVVNSIELDIRKSNLGKAGGMLGLG